MEDILVVAKYDNIFDENEEEDELISDDTFDPLKLLRTSIKIEVKKVAFIK